jgi:hypothetical protein
LEKSGIVKTGYMDFGDFCQAHGEFKKHPNFKSFYIVWLMMQKFSTNIVYDRFPGWALINDMILSGATNDEQRAGFKLMARIGLMHKWNIIVVLPERKQEKNVIDILKRRHRKTSPSTVKKCVEEQIKVFSAFADYFNLPTVHVSYDDPKKSIEKICNVLLMNML